jgi:hypothetical protein
MNEEYVFMKLKWKLLREWVKNIKKKLWKINEFLLSNEMTWLPYNFALRIQK